MECPYTAILSCAFDIVFSIHSLQLRFELLDYSDETPVVLGQLQQPCTCNRHYSYYSLRWSQIVTISRLERNAIIL